MPSSTLPSKQRIPGFAVSVLLVAGATWAISAFYTLRLNPELRYFAGAFLVKQAWAEKMTREHGAKVVAYGGSSCDFSIDAERLLLDHALPAVNLGRGAGMGASVLTQAAVQELRPGDTLVVALEPGLLTESMEPPSLGVQFSFKVDQTVWFSHPVVGTNSISWLPALLDLRPGGYHAFTILGKVIRRQQLYRYQLADLRPSGFNQTAFRLPAAGPSGHTGRVSPAGRALLRSLREWCAAHKVRVAYSLPWSYTPSDQVAAFQQLNARFLAQIVEILPVLHDPRLGAYTKAAHFADTPLHLTEEGAASRTDELAEQLKQWRVWTPEELRSRAQGGGAGP